VLLIKTVLVTGANGCVGYELIRALHRKYKIVAVDLKKDNIAPYLDRIDYYCIDLEDWAALSKVIASYDIEYVIHLAAKVHTNPQNKQDQEQFYKINVETTEYIFRLCLEKKVKRVVFFSTIAVYGGKAEYPNETTRANPLTLYAKTKYLAEEIGLEMVKEHGLPLCILRPATIYGRYDRGNYKSLLTLAQRRINVIPGKGGNYKPVVYVKDVVAVVNSLLVNEELKAGEIFNICENNYMYKELLTIINQVFGLKPLRIKIPEWIIDNWPVKTGLFAKLNTLSASVKIDNRKMLNVLNYKPRYDFRSGLTDAMDYYR
jgi:nucleoside-diphosphate-sugar epimerase